MQFSGRSGGRPGDRQSNVREPVLVRSAGFAARSYTDKLLQYLAEDQASDRPFFAYLAFTAPHWPLQAPPAKIEKYRGRYDAGYDQLRKQRLASLAIAGLVPRGLRQRLDNVPGYQPWKALSVAERRRQARSMEVYAAMIDEMDAQVGRLLDYLEAEGRLENTVIVFLSDNGPEGRDLSRTPGLNEWLSAHFDNSLANFGSASSYVYQGPGWATAETAPFYQVKGSAAEGGIRTPAFVWYPGFKRQADVSDALVTVRDIAPTLLSLAGISYGGDRYDGRAVEPVTGKSMTSLLHGAGDVIHGNDEAVAWELFGHRAVRRGDWKLMQLLPPFGDGSWHLYNLGTDPTEQVDFGDRQPAVVNQLLDDWAAYAAANGAVLPE